MPRTGVLRRLSFALIAAIMGTSLLGATPIKVLSGTIRSIDPSAGTVIIRPQNPASAPAQAFRTGPATVVVIGPDPISLSDLTVGARVTFFYDPSTRLISKLIAAASTPRMNQEHNERTTRTALKPRLPEPTRPASNSAGNADYVLDLSKGKTVKAVLTYEMSGPRISASEWVVYTPRAPELPGQRDVHTQLWPPAQPARDLSAGARPMLVARVAVDRPERSNGVEARAEYQATLVERHLRKRRPGEETLFVSTLDPGTRHAALAGGGSYELDAPGFRRWIDANHLTRESGESQVDYARRVFLAVKRGFSYEFAENLDRHVSRICATGRSDCGGLALVFAATLRTQKIPARILVGRWAHSASPGERLGGSAYYQWHVKAEFFADGVGWVPADPAMALVYDRSPEGLRYFGQDDGDFLTFHVDPDLVVDTFYFGPRTVFCMNGGLGVWVTGTGTFDRTNVRQDWQVRESGAPGRVTTRTADPKSPGTTLNAPSRKPDDRGTALNVPPRP